MSIRLLWLGLIRQKADWRRSTFAHSNMATIEPSRTDWWKQAVHGSIANVSLKDRQNSRTTDDHVIIISRERIDLSEPGAGNIRIWRKLLFLRFCFYSCLRGCWAISFVWRYTSGWRVSWTKVNSPLWPLSSDERLELDDAVSPVEPGRERPSQCIRL